MGFIKDNWAKALGLAVGGALMYFSITHKNSINPEFLADVNKDGTPDLVEVGSWYHSIPQSRFIDVYDGATSTRNEDGSYNPGNLIRRESILQHRSGSGGQLEYLFSYSEQGLDLTVVESTPDFPVSITRGEYKGIVKFSD
jgi:hypothetical protein